MSLDDRLRAWRAAAPGFRARQAKNLRQLRYVGGRPSQVSFVFGCQRSGTKMLMRILDESPATRIWHENNALAFDDFQLRSDAVVRALVALSPAPAQIFKPICDGQQADRLLAEFPAARGLWIFREPDAVARSAVQKWGGHQREVIDALVAGDLTRWGWRTALVPADVVSAIRSVHRLDLTDHEGAMLFWYLRNSFYTALGLDRHPRMLLVKYEDLVQAPERGFDEVFRHVGAPFDPRFLGRVHTESVRRGDPLPVSPAIRALCDELLARLETRARQPVPPPPVSPVLMLVNTLGVGGAERYVVTASNWLAEHGADVTVAAEDGELVAELGPGVVFEETELGRVRGGLPVAAERVRRIIRKRGARVIVGNSLVVTWVARLATLGTGVPIVNVAHGWPEARYRQVAPLMRVADVVVAVSPEVKAKLVAGGFPEERCTVIYNGVDAAPYHRRSGPTREAARAAMGAGPDDVVVLNVGRLTTQKAQHHVVTLATRLRERHPNLRFAVAGTGDRDDELAALVREAGVGDRVRLLGLRADVPDLLGAADIYLSCSDWEGMPLSTIEAMMSGLPTVATRTEGSDQLLTEACGVVVPVGDVDAMAEAIAGLTTDPVRRARLGAAARERALTSFGHDRMVRELADVLDRLVRGAER